MCHSRRLSGLATFSSVLCWAGLGAAAPAAGDVPLAESARAVLADRCYKCHGSEKKRGGLRLDLREDALRGGDSEDPALVAGDPARSALIRRITTRDESDRMPPKGQRLGRAEIALLGRWVKAGAPWARDNPPPTPRGPHQWMVVTDEDRSHWAFRPLGAPPLPTLRDPRWAKTPIDRFVGARLEAAHLAPGAEASRRTLIRRVYFDLVGLPPTPEEVSAFESVRTPEAYEKLADHLLASPQFGERWARHWLDAVRYADSGGYEEDPPRPWAYHYRDFVVRALNDDMPYDRFLQLQVAGDQLARDDLGTFAATGFLAAAPAVRSDFVNFRKRDRYDELDNIVSTMGTAVLGMSLGCARCHDHKYDPVPQRDYYRLVAAFLPSERAEVLTTAADEALDKVLARRLGAAKEALETWVTGRKRPLRLEKIGALKDVTEAEKALLRLPPDKNNGAQQAVLKRVGSLIKVDDKELQPKLGEADQAEWKRLQGVVDMTEAEKAKVPRVLGVRQGPPRKAYFLKRGDPDAEGDELGPGVLSVLLSSAAAADPLRGDRPARTQVASWLTDADHGAGALAARVIVNRLWQHHFGTGLVKTSENFGVRGEPPSHPELLEWLAAELVRNGWRLKPLHRLIVTSATYRQQSRGADAGGGARQVRGDPDGRLYAGRRPRRLEAEALRDAILSAGGTLNPAMYGPAVKPRIETEDIYVGESAYDKWPKDVKEGPATWRRSLYVFTKRKNPLPLLQAFDAPDSLAACARRAPTTVAPQALTLLNGQFVREQAEYFADRLIAFAEAGSARRSESAGGNGNPVRVPMVQKVMRAYEIALGRRPTPDEEAWSLAFLERQVRSYARRASGDPGAPPPERRALTNFCQVLFGLNEFLYVD